MDDSVVSDFLAVLEERPTLLRRRIGNADPLLLRVREIDRQTFACDALKIYSKRFESEIPYTNPGFVIKGASRAWGNVSLKDGELALVFVNRIGAKGQYYMLPWRGHFTVVEIHGELHAVANWHLLNSKECGEWEPEYLRSSAFFPEPDLASRVAMPYSLLERHLNEELDALTS